MTYRINLHLKGANNGSMLEPVDAPTPGCGETIAVTKNGREIHAKVSAVWTPAPHLQPGGNVPLQVVEAMEVAVGSQPA
jgi:hypothetical protein